MAIFLQPPPPNGCVECRCRRQKSWFSTNNWLSYDDWWSANNYDCPPCCLPQTPPRVSEPLFIITRMDDHDEVKRTKQNLCVRSGKSEAEVTNNRKNVLLTLITDVLVRWRMAISRFSRWRMYAILNFRGPKSNNGFLTLTCDIDIATLSVCPWRSGIRCKRLNILS